MWSQLLSGLSQSSVVIQNNCRDTLAMGWVKNCRSALACRCRMDRGTLRAPGEWWVQQWITTWTYYQVIWSKDAIFQMAKDIFSNGKHIPVICVPLVGESGFIWKQDRATFAAKHLTRAKTGTRSLFGSEKVIKRGTRYSPKHVFNTASCQLWWTKFSDFRIDWPDLQKNIGATIKAS